MNIYSLIPLIAFLFNGFVWTFIYAQKKQSSINRAFLIYAANLALWLMCVFILRSGLSDEVMPIMKTSSIAWISVAFWFLNFTYIFIEKKKDSIFYFFTALTVISIILSLSTNWVINGYTSTYFGPDEIPGILFLPIVLVVITIPAVYALYLISKKRKETTDYNLKHSLPLLFFGSMIILVIGLISNVVIPDLLHIENFYQFAESGTVIQSIFIFIAVKKYRLFSIGVEEVAHKLFSHMTDAVIIMDVYDRILKMNKAAEKLFGEKTKNLLKSNIHKLIPDYNSQEEYQNAELEIILNTENKILSLTHSNVEEAEVRIGNILIVRDITIRKEAEIKLKKSEQMFHGLFESAPDALVVVNSEGEIVRINKQTESLFGYSRDELKEKKVELLLPESFRKIHQKHREKYFANPHQRIMGAGLELYGQRKDSSKFPVDIMLSYLNNDEGINVIATIRDITERKRSEEIIRKHKLMLTQAEELAHLGSWEWNILENKVHWSEELFRIYGITHEEFDGTFESFIEKVHPDDRKHVKRSVEEAFEKRKHFQHYERIIQPEGNIRTLYTKGIVHIDEDGNPTSMFGSCLDVTDFKRVEFELRTSQQQLRALSASLQSAREEERTHIAREIHDELGQVLTAVKMDITLLNESILEEGITLPEVINELKSIVKLIDESIQTVRDIATELRPDVLDHLGLAAAIEWQLKEFQKRHKIETEFFSEIKYLSLDKEQTTAVFRIYQETLTNVIRHAECSKVEVAIVREGGFAVLKVRDNGKGISEKEINNIKSIGIIGMKERALIIGGKINITGSPGCGTMVTLQIPNRSGSIINTSLAAAELEGDEE